MRVVRYGAHPDQLADVTLPPAGAARPAPLVLLLHGGYWRAEHDRGNVARLAAGLAAEGFAVANVEYRRVGDGGGWPTTLTDVALACDALPALIADAHPGAIDRDAVVLVGHSSGGHLALWAALRHRLPPGAPGRTTIAPPLAGVVALAGVSDLTAACRADDRAVAALLGGGPDAVPERYAAADPRRLGRPAAATTLVHGDRDAALPFAMSRDYAAATGATLLAAPGAGHFELVDPRSSAWPVVLEATRRRGPVVRPARAQDAAAIAAIWREGWRDGHLGHVPQALADARPDAAFATRAAERIGDAHVAVLEGRVVGFAMVAGDEVEQVYVDRAARGSGVAGLLLDTAARLVGAAGHERAWLAVAAGNARARRFYAREGWADEGPFAYAAVGPDGPIAVPAHRYTAPTTAAAAAGAPGPA